jgi:hypothetical protein
MLLPVLTEMTQKKLSDLDPERKRILFQQLDGLMECMRAQTGLIIEQMFFYEDNGDAGDYKALPEDHQFRARPGTNSPQPGEKVQLFLQLRNVCSEKRNGFYETKLASKVQVADSDGKVWWFYDFSRRDSSARSKTLQPDQCCHYRFCVPHIPPGTYTFTVEVRDETCAGASRITRKDLPFRVRS